MGGLNWEKATRQETMRQWGPEPSYSPKFDYIRSKYKGTCRKCVQTWDVGTKIKRATEGWVHLKCPKKPKAAQ